MDITTTTSGVNQFIPKENLPRAIGTNPGGQNKDRMIISFAGGIGAGKTTLFKYLEDLCRVNELNYLSHSEEIVNWCANGENPDLLFDCYDYNDSIDRLRLQIVAEALITQRTYISYPEGINLLDRCYLDTGVFRDANDETLKPVDKSVLNEVVKVFKSIEVIPDVVIYVKTKPSVLIERIKKRDRRGEDRIKIEYLEKIHELYERKLEEVKDQILVIELDTTGRSIEEMKNELLLALQRVKILTQDLKTP